jgi:hypothetical protein
MTLRSHNPNNWSVYFAGNPIGDQIVSVEITPNNPEATIVSGIDGRSTRVVQNNFSYTVVLTLLASSVANNILSAIMTAQRSGANPAGVGAFSCLNVVTGEEITSPKCFIINAPSLSVGAELGERQWTLHAEDCVVKHVGSFPV